MFLDLTWNKDGKEHTTCVHISKLSAHMKALEKEGCETKFTVSKN
tara:strand:- start:3190 stop:3324 length:135 start_codon:yes stop_codon:yes gene_type:complete